MGTLNIFNEINEELNSLSRDSDNLKDYSTFHKDDKNHIHLSTPIIRKVTSSFYKKVKEEDKDSILELCDELLKSKKDSCRNIAFDLAFRIKKRYVEKDFELFETWLKKYIDSWGSCDDLCTHAFGYFIYNFPKFLVDVKRWSYSKNLWMRRASTVILVYSLRKKKYLENCLEIATILIDDEEDLVQKGLGWMLKEASNNYESDIYNFVLKNKSQMSRTALRYAIEKMPLNLKKELMKR
jgi:3-methyladenine DNA glycosylase AlkD